MFCPSRILVPVDFTSSATPAVACAHDLARAFGSRVHLLHVTVDPAAQGWATLMPNTELDSCAAAWRQDAIDELTEFAAETSRFADGLQGSYRTTLAVSSSADPAAAILAYAGEEGCDLIIMGTHRPSALAAILRGTAERVQRHATCPVMLVPPAVAVPVRRRWVPAGYEVGVAS